MKKIKIVKIWQDGDAHLCEFIVVNGSTIFETATAVIETTLVCKHYVLWNVDGLSIYPKIFLGEAPRWTA